MTVIYSIVCSNDECKGEWGDEYTFTGTYEELQDKLKEATCPTCKSPMRRNYAVGGVRFRGAGFTGAGRSSI